MDEALRHSLERSFISRFSCNPAYDRDATHSLLSLNRLNEGCGEALDDLAKILDRFSQAVFKLDLRLPPQQHFCSSDIWSPDLGIVGGQGSMLNLTFRPCQFQHQFG